MYDALLKLFPDAGAAGNISGAGTTQGSAKYLGRNRTYRAIGRVAGDVTGGTPTLAVSLEESTAATGQSWTGIPGSMTLTEQVGYVATTTPRYEVPSGVAVLPSLVFTTTKDYVRVVNAAGGTTPAFPGVSVYAEPVALTTLASGR